MSSVAERSALVTGASGFLGSHIAAHLRACGWYVFGLGRRRLEGGARDQRYLDLPDSALADLLGELRPQIIVHCAGPASVPGSVADPAADFAGTVPVMFQLLDSVRQRSPESAVLYVSSAAVYGNPQHLPVAETDAIEPISPYGFHRSQCEQLLQQFRVLYSIKATSLRVFSAFGVGLRRQVVWDLCIRALSEHQLRMHGTGQESRDFIHAADIAQAVTLLAETPRWHAAYNLGSGGEIAIAELARAISALLPVPVAVSFDGIAAPGMPARWCADISRLTELGFTPRHALMDELPQLLEHARSSLAVHA